MSILLGGIEVDPQIEGATEGCNERGPYATVPYLCDWDNRWPLVYYLAGTTSTTGANAPWIRPSPHRYPIDFAGASIYVKDAQIKGTGALVTPGGLIPAWTKAIVTATYGPLDYSINFGNDDPLFLSSLSDDPGENESLQYATQEIDYGAEWINIPNSTVGFSDGTKYDTPMSRPMTVIRMNITWHRYPVMPMNRIKDYAESVNDATFLGCERGTVYFEGVKTVREQASDGTITQKVQMSFKWRKHDWNEVMRPDDGAFDALIYNGDSSSSTFAYKNFRNLLL